MTGFRIISILVFFGLASSCSKCTSDQDSGSSATSDVRIADTAPASVTNWKTLGKLNLKKSIPEELLALTTKDISLAGYVVLNDATSVDQVTEFLLTPIAGACVHVPPPPPRFIVRVHAPKGKPIKVPFSATEVTGRLRILKEEPKEVPEALKVYNTTYLYEMDATKVEDFREANGL